MSISKPVDDKIKTEILTTDCLEFLKKLHENFEPRRQELLSKRLERQKGLDAGEMPDFLPSTKQVRDGDWEIAPLPLPLQRRWVEITGPVDRKMVINALNSGADCYMADFEDSNTPTWTNQLQGQLNLKDAIRRRIDFEIGGKAYKLKPKVATLLVRPRGFHVS
jgi:malate synthase